LGVVWVVCGKQGEEQMTTHITKTWFDGEKVVTQEIPESEIYKQEQEPVAWMYVNTDGECEQIEYGLCDFDDPSIQLLYTAPRHWVGLTEIEICDIEADELTSASSETFSFARAIEAKLKEKNNG
jgi:hypothetical protein